MSAFAAGMEWAEALEMVRFLTEEERESMAEADWQEDQYARWFCWYYTSESILGVTRLCEKHTEEATHMMWEADKIARQVGLPAGVGRVTKWGQVCAISVVTPSMQPTDGDEFLKPLVHLVPMPSPADLWRLLA